MRLPNIALSGRSGSGKSTVAEYLEKRYGYTICRTGVAVRAVCSLLFQSEAKEITNRVTDLLRSADEFVWVRAALRNASPDKPIVFDSMRFRSDYDYLSSAGFRTWQLQASVLVCAKRLTTRGQVFAVGKDETHRTETELLDVQHDAVIEADADDVSLLHGQIDRLLSR